MVRECYQSKDVDVDHIPGIINPSNIFTKEMKDNAQFRNLRDSMMVSLQAFLKYSHNFPTHIIPANKILNYYSIHIVADSLVVPEHVIPTILELQSGVR